MKLINEKLAVAEYKYPYYEKLNPILLSYISSLPEDPDLPQNVTAKMTYRNLENKKLDKLLRWIIQLLERDFVVKSGEDWEHHQINGLRWNIKCTELWAVQYQKGSSITKHTHAPYVYSFTYIVNSPKNSPPLIFSTSGHRVKSEEGKLVLWEGRLIHEVPPAKVDGRCIIAGTFQNVLSPDIPTEWTRSE